MLLETIFMLCVVGFVALMFASMWVVYTKAGKPGWAAIVPIYNVIVKLDIVGRPLWWLLLLLIPLVNLVVWVVMSIDLAKSFGKDALYGIGLALLPFVFHPMLAFGTATYQGPAAKSG